MRELSRQGHGRAALAGSRRHVAGRRPEPSAADRVRPALERLLGRFLRHVVAGPRGLGDDLSRPFAFPESSGQTSSRTSAAVMDLGCGSPSPASAIDVVRPPRLTPDQPDHVVRLVEEDLAGSLAVFEELSSRPPRRRRPSSFKTPSGTKTLFCIPYVEVRDHGAAQLLSPRGHRVVEAG